MSATLTRRRALAATAAAALGFGAPVAMAAAPSATGRPIGPEGTALREEFNALSAAYRGACREADATMERVVYPDPPEALYARPGDRQLFMRAPELSWSDKAEGRYWWADPETVERLRGDSFRFLDGSPTPATARRDEIVAAFDWWCAADRAAEDATGYTATQDRFEVAHAAYAAFRLRLVEMRTADPDVVALKALMVRSLCGGLDRLDHLIGAAVEQRGGAYEDALALSLTRDLCGLCADSGGQA